MSIVKLAAWGLLVTAAAMSPVQADAQTRPGLEAGVEAFFYHYSERFEGVEVAAHDAVFAGVTGSYVGSLGGGSFARVRVVADFGSADYHSPDGRIPNIFQFIGQAEAHFGHDFPLGGGAVVTPFAGIGGRYLQDESGGRISDLGGAGYDRKISYLYVPIGAAVAVPAGRKAVTFSAQYNYVVDGRARSEGAEGGSPFGNFTLDLDHGYGLEASVSIGIPLKHHLLSVGPFVRHWDVEQSDPRFFPDPAHPGEEIGALEPPSKSTSWGVRATYGF